MLMDLIATFAAGGGLVGFVIILRHLTKGRIPKWTIPAAFGLGMLLFSVWNEYSWYGRTTEALPGDVVILSTPTDKVIYRPWTYIFPVSLRFAALDRTGMVTSLEDSRFRRAEVMLVQRWAPTRRVPLAFDCAGSRRADLVEGAELAPDGTLSGGAWVDVGPDDELLQAACRKG
ncbi:hypothetical protein [Pseudorhodobacter aquimaris]|uniref:hypothetical protein n=1 Tax=Pseudorhodobacter aquimaris TaxID=687412 RepID=UPI00067DFA65|nr:hypothetical protein [Pseudorhodobacter aquimaris]